ncbi:hypothetical protein V8E53_009217 [Lactarius tabidus]
MPITRPDNKNKRPGLVDLSPQRRTHAQKRADDEKFTEDKQAREDIRREGIRRIAEVEERTAQKMKSLGAAGPKPRARMVTATSETSTGGAPKKVPTGKSSVSTKPSGPILNADMEEPPVKTKKTREERAMYRLEVEAEKTKEGPTVSNKTPLPVAHDVRKPNTSNDPKKDFAGARKVQSWMAKLQSTGPTFPPTQGSSASARSLATTVANTDHTASSESQPLVTPARSSSDGVGHCVSDVEASDGAYRDSVGKLPRYNERIPSMDIIEVNSPCGQSPVSNGFSSNKATENYREHNDSGLPVAQAEDDDVEMHPRAPSRNHDNDIDKGSNADSDKVQVVQVESESGIHVSIASKGAQVVKKATNKNLPSGAQPEFRREVIPTMWHWAAGHVADPFNIDEGSMVNALEIIWKCVYTKYVHFDIPPIVSVTNQRFAEWRNGFTSAATSALTSLFASDVAFLECDNRVMFASEMLEHYRFLYSDSLSEDHMEWTGMWRGPLFLQVFVSQLNATTSRVPIPELGSETQLYDGAMALAAAAVERTLTLIANGEIDIKLVVEDKEPTGSKRKRKSSKTSVWKVEQPNGPPQPFSDTLWGGATRDFMTSLGRVPHAAMNSIIDEASSVAMSQKAKPTPVNSEQQSDRAALAFR